MNKGRKLTKSLNDVSCENNIWKDNKEENV